LSIDTKKAIDIDLQMFSIKGELVLEESFFNVVENKMVEVSKMPEGQYLLKIIVMPDKVYYRKIIIH